jgi:hypothetical protein
MRSLTRLLCGLGLLLAAADVWAPTAGAKPATLILRNGKGGPVLPAPSHIGVEFKEIAPTEFHCTYGVSEPPPEELLNNSAPSDRLNATAKQLNCGFGSYFMRGTLTAVRLSGNGRGTLTADITAPTNHAQCFYAVTKLRSTFSLPKSFAAVEFAGVGRRTTRSLASCRKKETVVVALSLGRPGAYVYGET